MSLEIRGRLTGIWEGFSDKTRDKIMARVREGKSWEKEVEREFAEEIARFEKKAELG